MMANTSSQHQPVGWLITYASGTEQFVTQKPAVWPTPDCKITELYDRPSQTNDRSASECDDFEAVDAGGCAPPIFASLRRVQAERIEKVMSAERARAQGSELAEIIAKKAAEPAFVEFAKNWPLREFRLLPIIKMGPCAVSAWYVTLPSGKEIILSAEDWEAAHVQSPADSAIPADDHATLARHREDSALLIEAMLTHEPHSIFGHRKVRMALTLAARAVRRGRHLTAREQMLNLAKGFDEPTLGETADERAACAALAGSLRTLAGT